MSDIHRTVKRSAGTESAPKPAASHRVPTHPVDSSIRLLTAQSVIDLQGRFGNRAVSSFLESIDVASTRPTVQRFEAGEHAQFGPSDLTKETIFVASLKHHTFTRVMGKPSQIGPDELLITYADVSALGDFYDSFAQFHRAVQMEGTYRELVGLIDLVRRDTAAFSSFAAKVRSSAVTNKQWEDATGGRPKDERFVALAARNEAHFAPSIRGKAESNLGTWMASHFRAIDLAVQGKVDEALLMNAFGDHFLEDAFSAGHLKSEADLMELARVRLELGGEGLVTNETIKALRIKAFAYAVAQGILGDSEGSGRLSQYLIRARPSLAEAALAAADPLKHPVFPWRELNADNLSDVITLAGSISKRKAFLHVFAKAVHDRLNRDINRRFGGIEVRNAFDRWRLAGDQTLSSSPETLKWGRLAVARSRQNILDVARMQQTLDMMSFGRAAKDRPDKVALARQVLQYVPHPTEKGEAAIQYVVDTLTDPNSAEAVKAFVQISLENLPTLVDELTEMHVLTLKTSLRGRTSEGNAPAPWVPPGVSPVGEQPMPPLFSGQ